eukprot:1184007-Prorocentrum_minimum.AAC.4
MKSRTKGYASMEYSLIGNRKSDLVKLDIKINGDPGPPHHASEVRAVLPGYPNFIRDSARVPQLHQGFCQGTPTSSGILPGYPNFVRDSIRKQSQGTVSTVFRVFVSSWAAVENREENRILWWWSGLLLRANWAS